MVYGLIDANCLGGLSFHMAAIRNNHHSVSTCVSNVMRHVCLRHRATANVCQFKLVHIINRGEHQYCHMSMICIALLVCFFVVFLN